MPGTRGACFGRRFAAGIAEEARQATAVRFVAVAARGKAWRALCIVTVHDVAWVDSRVPAATLCTHGPLGAVLDARLTFAAFTNAAPTVPALPDRHR